MRSGGGTTMHRYFEDGHVGIDLGVRTHVRARLTVDGGGGSIVRPTPPPQPPKDPKAETKPAPTPTTTIGTRDVKVDGGRTKSVPVTPTDQVREAVKDGSISAKERTTFEQRPKVTDEVIAGEQERLAAAVRDAASHAQRSRDLAASRATEGLDALDTRIEQVAQSGATDGLKQLREQRATRVAEEAKVVDVVEDKLALVGTLEANRIGTTGEERTQLTQEITTLNETIDADLLALSNDTLDSLERHVAPIDGILDPRPVTEAGGSTGRPDPVEDNGTRPPQPTRDVEIDYSTPEHRQQVLDQARERNFLPSEHVAFDDDGQAVYTVQSGDSYWRIADASDGRPAGEFDPAHFGALVNSNSERLGRDPQQGLIHPGEQVVLQGRSLDELVQLLDLPATE